MKKNIAYGLATAAGIGGILFAFAGTTFAYRGDPAVKGPNYTVERHEAMEKAFASNDYASWKTLMQGRGRMTTVITAENFAKFAEAHRLAEEGKIAEANAIRAELGLGNGAGAKSGFGKGQGQGCGMGRMNGGNR